MALDSKNNIKSVFIVPSQTAITTGTITPGSVATGSVVVTNVSNEVLDATTVVNYSTIKIVKDRGDNLPLQQVRLNIADIIAYSGACGEPSREQVTYIGYNGTSGVIAGLTANTFYEVKLEHVPNQFAYGKRPANYKYGTWKSGVTAPTQADVAHNIQASLVQNFKPNRTIDWRVITELVTNNAGASAGAATSFGVTRYSKTVTLNGATTAVAGDYLRLGGSTTAAPVYKIAAVNSPTNIILEVPYQGATGSIASTNVELITAALAATSAFGIKITGIKQKYDVNRWRQYDKVRFNPFINEAFTTTPVATNAAFDGVGVYEQAANDEYISWGDEGQIFVDQVPPLFREQDASKSIEQSARGAYDVAVLGWLNKLPSLIGAGENKGSAIFYMDDACTDQAFELITILNAWLTNKFAALVLPCCEE
jgi:hypothetical protein